MACLFFLPFFGKMRAWPRPASLAAGGNSPSRPYMQNEHFLFSPYAMAENETLHLQSQRDRGRRTTWDRETAEPGGKQAGA